MTIRPDKTCHRCGRVRASHLMTTSGPANLPRCRGYKECDTIADLQKEVAMSDETRFDDKTVLNAFGQDTALVSEKGYRGHLVTLDCPLKAGMLKHWNIGSPLYIAPWTENSAEHDPNEPAHVGILVSIYHAEDRVWLELKHPKNNFSEPYFRWHEARGSTPFTFKQVDWFTSSHFLTPKSLVFIGVAA